MTRSPRVAAAAKTQLVDVDPAQLYGVFSQIPYPVLFVDIMSPDSLPPAPRSQQRRLQLLEAAEQAFLEKGYVDTSISDITRAADVGHGTFYLYFDGKADIFETLVVELGHIARERLSEAVKDAGSRLEAEYAGLKGWLMLLAERPSLHRIVEEARVFAPQAHRKYYEDFASNYTKQLKQAQENGEIAPGDAEVQAWALIGLTRVLGDRYVLWDRSADPEDIANSAFALIRDGLRKG